MKEALEDGTSSLPPPPPPPPPRPPAPCRRPLRTWRPPSRQRLSASRRPFLPRRQDPLPSCLTLLLQVVPRLNVGEMITLPPGRRAVTLLRLSWRFSFLVWPRRQPRRSLVFQIRWPWLLRVGAHHGRCAVSSSLRTHTATSGRRELQMLMAGLKWRAAICARNVGIKSFVLVDRSLRTSEVNASIVSRWTTVRRAAGQIHVASLPHLMSSLLRLLVVA